MHGAACLLFFARLCSFSICCANRPFTRFTILALPKSCAGTERGLPVTSRQSISNLHSPLSRRRPGSPPSIRVFPIEHIPVPSVARQERPLAAPFGARPRSVWPQANSVSDINSKSPANHSPHSTLPSTNGAALLRASVLPLISS